MDEIEFKRMNINQVENIMYGAKILKQIDASCQKTNVGNNKTIMESKDRKELDSRE